jgi:chromosome segregation ATPase
MERIQTREKSLNSQYKARVAEYHEIQEKLTEVSKRYDESNEAVLEQQNALTAITDELETIRFGDYPPSLEAPRPRSDKVLLHLPS